MEISVDDLRRQTLEKIKDDVQRAYENRKVENLIPEIENTDEELKKAKEQKGWLDNLSEKKVVNTGSYKRQPNEAIVTNSHDFRDLLAQAYTLLSSEGYFKPSKIPQVVNKNLEHELEHSVPALGNGGLEIRYGVKFFEDKKRNYRGIIPFVNLSGTMNIDVYRDVVGAVKKLSAADEILFE